MNDALPRWRTAPAAVAADAVGRPSVYLLPGELFASAEPTVVSTVLGSCVSICLFDASRRIGGLNHFLLPYQVGAAAASPRFGPTALAALLARLDALGARRGALHAKVFGGSHALHGSAPSPNAIGIKNARVAFHLLAEVGIPVAAEETGGHRGRRLLFETDTGLAHVRNL